MQTIELKTTLFLKQPMVAARDHVKLRKELGWGEVDEMIEWLNPEDPARGVEKRASLARYVHYSRENVVRGYLALPCLSCPNHAVCLAKLAKKP